MRNKTIKAWEQETLRAEGLIFKACFLWLGQMLVLPILAIVSFLGGAPNLVKAAYSCFITIPVLVLFQLNALVFFILALAGVGLNYNGALYGAVKWIEQKQLYNSSKSKI